MHIDLKKIFNKRKWKEINMKIAIVISVMIKYILSFYYLYFILMLERQIYIYSSWKANESGYMTKIKGRNNFFL